MNSSNIINSQTKAALFENQLKQLANFRNAHDPFTQRIQLIRQNNLIVPVLVGCPHSFWQRVCEKIYKRKSLRLPHIVSHTIQYLKDNKEYLDQENNITNLKTFRSKLYTIHGLEKKVGKKAVDELDKLFSDAQEKQKQKKENTKKTFEDNLLKAKQEAEKKVQNAQEKANEIAENQKQAEVGSAEKVRSLKKELEKRKFNSDNIVQNEKEKAFNTLKEKKIIFLFPAATNFNLNKSMPPEDTLFVLPSQKNKTIFTHSIFFQQFIQKTKSMDSVFPYCFDLDKYTPAFDPEKLNKFISLVRGGEEIFCCTFAELIEFCYYAENLQLEELSNALFSVLERYFFENKTLLFLVCYELNKLKPNLNSNITKKLLDLFLSASDYFSTLFNMSIFFLIPDKVFPEIANFLGTIPSNHPYYPTFLNIINDWKRYGLI